VIPGKLRHYRISLAVERQPSRIAGVDTRKIISALNAEIHRLTVARDALIGNDATRKTTRSRRGRVWSVEARARQSRAMKQRWAQRKKSKT